MTEADIHITDQTTAETRIYRDGIPWDMHTPGLWECGNYACDCNRALFFAWAAGDPDPDSDRPCGMERFTVKVLERATGRVLYQDDDD